MACKLKALDLPFWLVRLLQTVAKGRGDLFQIAAPDTTSNAAKQEILMKELRKFSLLAATPRPQVFDFERASLVLLAGKQRIARPVITPASNGRPAVQGGPSHA